MLRYGNTMYLCKNILSNTVIHKLLRLIVFSTFLLSANSLHADLDVDRVDKKIIEVKLGDYRYMPATIQLVIDQPVVLRLVNTDSFTPHNFSLQDSSDGLDVDVDVPAGKTVDVQLMGLWPGTHTFYCKNKLMFMDSHREKGMEGILTVVPGQL